MDKPVLDTTWIEVLVTRAFTFCLYIHLNMQSGVKASQAGLIIIQYPWTEVWPAGNCNGYHLISQVL